MGGSLLLQIFLLVNFVAIGVAATIAVQYWLKHYRPHRSKPSDEVSIPPEIKEHILIESQARFQSVIEKSVQSLEQDLEATSYNLTHRLDNLGSGVDTASSLLNKLLEKLGKDMDSTSTTLKTKLDELGGYLEKASKSLVGELEKDGVKVISDEMKQYQDGLKQLSHQTEASLGQFQKEIADFEAQLKVQLEQDMAAQKELLNQQLETKLNNAISAFLQETLQHNVDLGAQTAYLTAMLEEHKADLLQEVGNEAGTTK